MGQFVANATALGHEVWAYPNNQYPEAHIIPTARLAHIKTMRQMDVLYIRLENRSPQICTWSLPPRRLLYGFPLVVWEFNTIPDDASFRGESQESINKMADFLKYYGRGCDLAVCVAEGTEKYVRERLDIRRTLVVPNGSDPQLFNPEVQSVKRMQPFRDAVNIVWIGSAGIKYHDFDTLKEAANLLWGRGQGDHLNFHIIGSNLVGAMSDMPPNVYYWGAEEYQKLPHWLAAMDIGLYITQAGPSAHGSPLKVFDYMSSGLAVVSTAHPSIRELFDQLGQPDLMVPTEDSNRLADTLIQLASDKDRIRRQGQAGRQLVVDHYNWRRAVKDTMDELEKLLLERHQLKKQ